MREPSARATAAGNFLSRPWRGGRQGLPAHGSALRHCAELHAEAHASADCCATTLLILAAAVLLERRRCRCWLCCPRQVPHRQSLRPNARADRLRRRRSGLQDSGRGARAQRHTAHAAPRPQQKHRLAWSSSAWRLPVQEQGAADGLAHVLWARGRRGRTGGRLGLLPGAHAQRARAQGQPLRRRWHTYDPTHAAQLCRTSLSDRPGRHGLRHATRGARGHRGLLLEQQDVLRIRARGQRDRRQHRVPMAEYDQVGRVQDASDLRGRDEPHRPAAL